MTPATTLDKIAVHVADQGYGPSEAKCAQAQEVQDALPQGVVRAAGLSVHGNLTERLRHNALLPEGKIGMEGIEHGADLLQEPVVVGMALARPFKDRLESLAFGRHAVPDIKAVH